MDGGFCFDFGGDDAGASAATPPQVPADAPEDTPADAADPPASVVWRVSAEEAADAVAELDQEEVTTQKVEGIKLARLQPTLLPEESCGFGRQLKTHDILPGVYEGGFKLWSCAGDLVRYLREADVSFEGKTVMEAGCGHGVPAIHALQSKAGLVVLQDYNVEVLKLLTVPNVLMNTKMDVQILTGSTAFWAGDWRKLAEEEACAAQKASFDVILSTDTLYTRAAIRSLLVFLKAFMAYPNGVTYVGSKTVCVFSPLSQQPPPPPTPAFPIHLPAPQAYFGCGGGVVELHEELARQGGDPQHQLQAKQVKVISDGVDNMREILELSWVTHLVVASHHL